MRGLQARVEVTRGRLLHPSIIPKGDVIVSPTFIPSYSPLSNQVYPSITQAKKRGGMLHDLYHTLRTLPERQDQMRCDLLTPILHDRSRLDEDLFLSEPTSVQQSIRTHSLPSTQPDRSLVVSAPKAEQPDHPRFPKSQSYQRARWRVVV